MDHNTIDLSFDYLGSQLPGNSPCGIEIDYDPEFLELENMVSAKAEQQYGDTIIPAAPIDWSRALTKANELLEKSKDYRLCSIITRALTHKHGIQGTLKGLETIHALTENCWHECYPAITFDGETDLFPRANAIAELNSPSGLLGDLRNTDITLGTAGKISIGRLEKILSGRADSEDFSRDQLLQILQDETYSQNGELLAIKVLLTRIIELERQLTQHFGGDQSPDFSQIKSLLTNANPIQEREAVDSTEPEEDTGQTQSDIGTDHSTQKMAASSIKTRSDAIKWLDKVCEFLEKNDPANPAPLLIKRARNMIGQDFYTILSQLAPDAVAQAEHITGPKF